MTTHNDHRDQLAREGAEMQEGVTLLADALLGEVDLYQNRDEDDALHAVGVANRLFAALARAGWRMQGAAEGLDAEARADGSHDLALEARREDAWNAYREAYLEFQREVPQWRAFFTLHHQHALGAALKAYDPHERFADETPARQGAADDDTTRLRAEVERLNRQISTIKAHYQRRCDNLTRARDERQARIDKAVEAWHDASVPMGARLVRILGALTQVSQPQPTEDSCRAYEVDGEPVRVHGGAPMSAAGQEALAEVVRAAKRRLEADSSKPQPGPCGSPDAACGARGGSARCGVCTDLDQAEVSQEGPQQ
ncbi:hypothetical protein ABZ215_13705 [Amycolatopsis sp. NPDC006131]|uniref:hypothetical protein n=1 Tax=Amycolatopsis sp. NPDC006131 TaxID=3156731 RepID=UPI0033A9C44F